MGQCIHHLLTFMSFQTGMYFFVFLRNTGAYTHTHTHTRANTHT